MKDQTNESEEWIQFENIHVVSSMKVRMHQPRALRIYEMHACKRRDAKRETTTLLE